MKRIISLLLILISIKPLISQNLEISGKLNNFFTYNYYNPDSDLYKEDMGDYFLENFQELNTEIRLTNTLFTYGLFDLDIKLFELMDQETNQPQTDLACELNQAYINILLADWLYLEVGKKTLDLFFLANPLCAELGVISDWFMLNPFVVLYDDLAYSGYGVKFMTWAIIPLTDLYFRFYYAKNDLYNLGLALEATPLLQVPGWEELILQAGLELQQKSERLIMEQEEGIPLPVLQTREDREDFYKDAEVSISYTIPLIDTMLKVEYYYIDDAYTPAELEELIDNGFTTQILDPTEMSRHNLLIHLSQPHLTSRLNNFTDTLSLSGTLIINLMDDSGFLQAGIESSYVENCTLALEGGYFFGPDKSEYSLVQKKWFLGFKTSIGF